MQENSEKLLDDCIKELESIKFKIKDNPEVGVIDIKTSKKATKRYGCCKHEKPDKKYYHTLNGKYGKRIVYDRFKVHHIEISEWVMQLDEKIIKNTIIHEILHCLPACNNHGVLFRQYADYINENLNYNISRLGNREEDFKFSNIEYNEKTINYKYKIYCKKCGHIFYRQRMKKNLIKKYCCSLCGGRLELNN